MRRCLLALVALFALPGVARAADLAQYVDPMIGTLGAGFVFPGADMPFGMVQNSPDTRGPLVYSGYMGNDPIIRGFSLVHLSGPGVAKAGDLPFMPWVGAGAPPTDPNQYEMPFSKAGEQAQAGYYAVRLGNGVGVELTASTHAAMQRYAFPPAADGYLIVDPKHNNDAFSSPPGISENAGEFAKTGASEITGSTFGGRYHVFFVARFDQPILDTGANWVKFAPGQTVTMRVGISFVDKDGARRNLDAEAPAGVSFDAMRAQAYAAWNTELGRVQVSGSNVADKRTFYTALYHALLHPNTFEDVDRRYRGYDDQIHVAEGRVQYANFSSWDTYKAQNQLLALAYPGRYADMLRSLRADAEQGGRLPRWGEENYDASHMSGDPAIPMIADGMCRGLIGGDDAETLYEQSVALRAHRDASLDSLGFLPMNPGTTLEYGVADFALALMAQRLGRHDEAQQWLARSLNYRNIFDPETKWVRPRNADGTWYPGQLPTGWSPSTDNEGFQEGNSWQYSWLVPQDPRGLFDRMGGDAAAVDRLDHLFAAPAEVQNRVTGFGTTYVVDQWAPGNEHDLGAPFLYPFARQPWKTQAELRAAQGEYRPIAEGLPGNDDLGSLSAWYVLSAIGISPFTPGAPLWMVGSPLFEQTSIAIGKKGRFTIDAAGASLAGKYVQSAALNGKPLNRAWFEDTAIRKNGTLRLEMGATPNTAWAADAADVPPSASDSPLSDFGCTT